MAGRKMALLIDLSGTIHIEDNAISGSLEAIKQLRDDNKFTLKFVTNTTKESINCLVARLSRIGFDIAKSEIFTSLTAARHLLEKEQLKPLLLLEDVAMEDFAGIDTTDRPNAVVVGLSPSQFHYEKLNEAFRHILNGCKLIGIHKARYYKRADGLALGPGPFVAALEYATNQEATIVGKPMKEFFLWAMGNDLKAEDCIVIGDDVRDDVIGALDAGMRAVLVKTGKYRQGDERLISQSPRARLADSFPQAVQLLAQNNLFTFD